MKKDKVKRDDQENQNHAKFDAETQRIMDILTSSGLTEEEASQLINLSAEGAIPNIAVPEELLDTEYYDIGEMFDFKEPPKDPTKPTSMREAREQSTPIKEYTGGSVSYYKVEILEPTTPGTAPYTAECNDIIEALGMNFAEGNAFKAIWRTCAARKGRSKEGYKDGVYDAEKVVFFGERMVAQAKRAKDK